MDRAPIWRAHWIGTRTPWRCPHAVAVGPEGEVLLVGRHEGRVDLRGFGRGILFGPPGELFGLALGREGAVRWYEAFATAAGDRSPWAVAADPEGGCYLAGPEGDMVTILKLSGAGARIWTRSLTEVLPARDAQPLALAVDARSRLLVFGHERGASSVGPSGTPRYLFLATVDRDGSVVGKRRFRFAGHGLRPRVAIDAEGCVLASGAFQGTIEIGGETLTSQAWAAYAFKLDPNGGVRWAKRFSSAAPSSIACGIDAAGVAVVGGLAEREIGPGEAEALGTTWELAVRAFAPDGAPLWERHFPCPPCSRSEMDVAVAHDGGVLLGGTVDVSGAFVVKLAASGDLAWCQEIPRRMHVVGMTVHAAPEGGVVAAGSCGGRPDAGAGLENPAEALFVLRLEPREAGAS